MPHNDARSCSEHDLLRRRSAVWLWCLPTAGLFASAAMGDARWWIWCPALIVMGAACLANAARCGRRHCYLTGPVLLVAALLSALRGTHVLAVDWDWIIGVILIGWAAGCLLEWSAGPYPANRVSDR